MKHFLCDQSGAVTVDWVVLTAALCGLGLAVMTGVSGGVREATASIASTLTDSDVVAMSKNFGQPIEESDPELVAIRAVLGADETDTRLDYLLDVATEEELQAEHATWSSYLAGGRYDDREGATAELALVNRAMDTRGIEPQRTIARTSGRVR